jgi:threonine-phosphate decarboxylase
MRKLPPPYTDPSYLFRHGGPRTDADKNLLDFSTNVNPLGPPPSVLKAIRRALPEIARYPDPDCTELKKLIVRPEQLDPEQIVVGNGSSEIIQAIARAFKPRRVAIVDPTYTEYLRASLLVGATVDHWLAEGENFDLEPFDLHDVDLVWLCQPNNPTGRYWRFPKLEEWTKHWPKVLFVVDQSFAGFSTVGRQTGTSDMTNCLWLLGIRPNLIVVKSLTKYYALPGLRIGYAAASAQTAQAIRAELPPWSVNTLAQVAAAAALNDRPFWRRTLRWLEENGDAFYDGLGSLAQWLAACPSSANFVLCRLMQKKAADLSAQLAQRGFLIRDASNFVGLNDSYVRIGMRTPEDNQRLVEALRSVLEQ